MGEVSPNPKCRGEDPRVQFGGKFSAMFSLGKPLPPGRWVVGEVKVFPVCFLFLYFVEGFFVARFWWVLGKKSCLNILGNEDNDNDDVFLKCADAVGMFLISIAQYTSYK